VAAKYERGAGRGLHNNSGRPRFSNQKAATGLSLLLISRTETSAMGTGCVKTI
jgi:hypothetical protein